MATATPPEKLQYQLSHPEDNTGPALVAGLVVALVISTIFVALRFWSRRLVGAVLGADDWTMAVALVRTTMRLRICKVPPS